MSALVMPIVGGQDADQPYPFMVSVQDNTGEHFCGGSLVRSDWVLTAAHCVQNDPPADIKARTGSNDLRAATVYPIAKVIVHPEYDGEHPGNDIALLKLATPVQTPPIQIGTAPVGTATRLLGWGQTCPRLGECDLSSTKLRQLDTRLLEPTRCLDIDGTLELCTDSPGGVAGACHGDSGGPQVVRDGTGWRVIGVTSRAGDDSLDCGTGPSIYTSAGAYVDWINAQTT